MSPRLVPSLFREAARLHPCLPLLLPECRTISQARQELRWLMQEQGSSSLTLQQKCSLRSRHVPLQYILGSQPFGKLDIICRKNVLIPRWETEEWTISLAQCIRSLFQDKNDTRLRVWDLCTGTGCIPLTILSETKGVFEKNKLEVQAIDCSSAAVALAKLNFEQNFTNDTNTKFTVRNMDVLEGPPQNEFDVNEKIDILTCNPPYISQKEFIKDVRSSVRAYEPRLALVADLEFYQNLVQVWIKKDLIQSFVYEIGNEEQANYVINSITNEPLLRSHWVVDLKLDSDDRPRCVYGYKTNSRLDLAKVFKSFCSSDQ